MQVAGVDILGNPEGIRQYLGLVSHAPLLYDDLSAMENLQFYARLYGMTRPDARISELLEQVGLYHRRRDLARTFSRGMVQRLAIARALLHNPPILLLDEPDTGLDPQAAEMMTRLAARPGRQPTHGAHDHPSSGARPGVGGSDHDSGRGQPGVRRLRRRPHLRRLAPPLRPLRWRRNRMKRYLQVILAVLWKDVRVELRTKDAFTGMAVFAALALLIFNFAFELRVPDKAMVVPGVLWVTVAFAGVLGLGRAFINEKDKGSLAGLLLAPVDRSAIYFGKMLANLIFILVVEAFILPLIVIFFNVPVISAPLLLVLLLGTIGLAAVGTVFSALAVNTRAREVLLPVLLFPVLLPVLVAGIRTTIAFLEGQTLADVSNWLRLMVLFDVLFLVVAFLTFDYVVEE